MFYQSSMQRETTPIGGADSPAPDGVFALSPSSAPAFSGIADVVPLWETFALFHNQLPCHRAPSPHWRRTSREPFDMVTLLLRRAYTNVLGRHVPKFSGDRRSVRSLRLCFSLDSCACPAHVEVVLLREIRTPARKSANNSYSSTSRGIIS